MIFMGGRASLEAKTPERSAPGAKGAGKLPDGGVHFKPATTRKVTLIQGLRGSAAEFDPAPVGSVIKNDRGGGVTKHRSPPHRARSQDGGLEPP